MTVAVIRQRLLLLGIAAALIGCSGKPARPSADYAFATVMQTDVIGIEEAYMSPKFWIDRADSPGDVVLSAADIEAFNARSFTIEPTMVRLADLPASLDREALLTQIRRISNVPDTPRYYPNGSALTDADYSRYEAALDIAGIADSNPVRFGLVVRRSNMRTYPTDDVIHKTTAPTNLDRFQENGLFPGDAVAVLHTSSDGDWLLVQSFNYLAWVLEADVAIGDREVVLDYRQRADFIVVTGDKVRSNFNPQQTAISELQLDMGTRLPLVAHERAGNNVDGQNPYATWPVELPVRGAGGDLRFAVGLIPRSADVSRGYLPYTRQNLIRQAFKFLGERYGWGHSYNARDCTGFVSEVYKTFGLFLPRNSSDQSRSDIGANERFAESMQLDARVDAIQSLEVGNLVYVPGHVMLYLGEVDGQPYVIHDVDSLSYHTPDGEFYSGVLSGVSVTPLMPLRSLDDESYVETMSTIKKIK